MMGPTLYPTIRVSFAACIQQILYKQCVAFSDMYCWPNFTPHGIMHAACHVMTDLKFGSYTLLSCLPL